MNVIDVRKNGNKFLKDFQSTTQKDRKIEKDSRFWELDYDKQTKVGAAIIRPIGPADGESDMFVTEYSHFLKKSGKFLVTGCPTTVGQKCPICAHYWNTPKEERNPSFSKTTKFIFNILVVNDKQHPENNGKVMLWKCPVSVMNKIKEQLKESDEFGMKRKPINVFDMWEGANVRVVTSEKSGYISYERSTVEVPSPIFEDVDNVEIYETLYKKLMPLSEFKVAPSPEELKTKFEAFMGMNNSVTPVGGDESFATASQPTSKDNSEDIFGQVEPQNKSNTQPKNVKVEADDIFGDLVD